MYWSYLLAAIGIVGLYLVGKKLAYGFIIGIAAQVLWIVYALVTQQYGFIATAVAYAVMNAINLRKWSTAKDEDVEINAARADGYIQGLQAGAETINVYGERGGIARILRSIKLEKEKLNALKE